MQEIKRERKIDDSILCHAPGQTPSAVSASIDPEAFEKIESAKSFPFQAGSTSSVRQR